MRTYSPRDASETGLRPARSYLYVPADRPDRLGRAHTRGADALIVDFEDSVPPAAKSAARENFTDWLRNSSGLAGAERACPVWVRVNQAGSDGLPPLDDLAAAVHPAVKGILVPKCESLEELQRLDVALLRLERMCGIPDGSMAIAALIETAAGLQAVQAIARAPRVARLQIGEADLRASLRMTPGPDNAEMLPLRLSIVVASAAAGIAPPVGPVHIRIDDLGDLRRSTDSLRRLGFFGRAAVHPAQIPVIHDVFTPSSEETQAAADVLRRMDAARLAGGGVARAADGGLVDAAVARSARIVVEVASGHAPAPGQGAGDDDTDW